MKKCMKFLALTMVTLLTLTACGRNDELISYDVEPDLSGQAQVAESPEQPSTSLDELDGIFHQFDDLGFSVVFPASWEGRYGLEYHEFEHEYGTTRFVSVFHPATREELESDYVGWLFSIIKAPGYFYENPVGIILAIDDEYSFLMNFPTDVQWNYLDPESESAPEYREMSEQLVLIADSFRQF